MLHWKVISILFLFFTIESGMSGASQWSPSEYIDVTRYGNIVGPAASLIRYVAEYYGSDDADQTARVLVEAAENVEKLYLGGSVQDKFGLKNKSIKHEEVKRFSFVAHQLEATNDDTWVCELINLENLFQTIKVIFGKNLEEFAAGKQLREHNLHIFLLHYTKRALSKCFGRILGEKPKEQGFAQLTMDKIVTKDPDIWGSLWDKTLLGWARDLDLLGGKYDAKAMLDAVEDGSNLLLFNNQKAKPYERLFQHLLRNCNTIEQEHGKKIEILNWTILLIPEEVKNLYGSPGYTEYFKLREYTRICLPVRNQTKVKALKKNIKLNMPSFLRGLNCLSCGH